MQDALPFVEWHRIDIRGERFVPRVDAWMDVRLPWAAMRLGANVLHCPANAAPRLGPPVVLSILDLIPIHTEPDTPHVRQWFRRLRAAASRAHAVLTISAASRDDIIRLLGVSERRIHVHALAPWQSGQGLAPDVPDLPLEASSEPKRPPYVFVFGSLRPNKNLSRLLQAWASLSDVARCGHRVMLVGLSPSERHEVEAMVARLHLVGTCDLVGQVPDTHLAQLLRGATALAYVSTMEGFGLPILEGFMAGVPVITSMASSMPEVAGHAALLVNPFSIEDIADALTRLLADAALRESLVALGKERVSQFSWQDAAEQLRAALTDAAGAST